MKSVKFQRREAKRRGRPDTYRDEYADRVYDYALLGATDVQMTSFFHTSIQTFFKWKKEHPDFLEALNRGKADADATVAKSLFHSARGYSHQAVKIFMNDGIPVYVPYVEHYPPNPTSAIFWLKNRHPEMWRDRKAVEVSGTDGGPIDVRLRRIESRVIDSDCQDITDTTFEDVPTQLKISTSVVD